MQSLDLWGAIAASVLAIECIIFNIIFLGLAFGLWKGSAWLRVNAGRGLDKVGEWLAQSQAYVQKGERIIASPFIRLRGRVTGLRTTLERLRE